MKNREPIVESYVVVLHLYTSSAASSTPAECERAAQVFTCAVRMLCEATHCRLEGRCVTSHL